MTDDHPWLHDFWNILTLPIQSVFLEAAGHAKNQSIRIWLLISILGGLSFVPSYAWVKRFPDLELLAFGFIIVPLVYLFWIFFIHRCSQKLFQMSENHYEELFYVVGFIFSISITWMSLAVMSGWIAYVIYGLGIVYLLILTVAAVHAITQLRLWQTIVAVGIGSLVAPVIGTLFYVFLTRLIDVMVIRH